MDIAKQVFEFLVFSESLREKAVKRLDDAVLKAYSEAYDTCIYESNGSQIWLIGYDIEPSAEIIYHIFINEPENYLKRTAAQVRQSRIPHTVGLYRRWRRTPRSLPCFHPFHLNRMQRDKYHSWLQSWWQSCVEGEF